VVGDNRINDAKSAGEQKCCCQREEQNKLERDGPRFIQKRQCNLLASFENITDATNRVDQLRLEGIIYFCP
jgi:hypothetical protein